MLFGWLFLPVKNTRYKITTGYLPADLVFISYTLRVVSVSGFRVCFSLSLLLLLLHFCMLLLYACVAMFVKCFELRESLSKLQNRNSPHMFITNSPSFCSVALLLLFIIIKKVSLPLFHFTTTPSKETSFSLYFARCLVCCSRGCLLFLLYPSSISSMFVCSMCVVCSHTLLQS